MSDFTYLGVHTHFSRAGGPASAAAWCARARELGYTSIGIADRSPLAGWPAMHRAARQYGLELIYGMEADINLPPDNNRKGKTPPEPAVQGALLLAHSPEGARNMAHLAAVAYTGWPAHEHAIPWDALATHSQGLLLIVLGGDEAGALQPIAGAEARKAEGWATALRSVFKDAIYLGLPHSGRPGDTALVEAMASQAMAVGLPLVALPPARYLQPGDAPRCEALKVARTRAGWPRVSSGSSTSIASDRHGYDYLRSPDEALALYERWPGAIENAIYIAGLAAQHGNWPFEVADDERGRVALLEIAEQRLARLLGIEALPPEAHDRLAREIGATGGWGSAGAWTALAALAARAQDVNTPVPYDAADGSMLAYALGIALDNPAGAESPLDEQAGAHAFPGMMLPSSGRSTLLSRMSEEYGQDRVAQALCALDITAVQALGASASVLGIESDLLRSLILPAVDEGWQAVANVPGDSATAKLAHIALALKGAPLTFVPDHETALVAPRAVYGSDTLASWSPLLYRTGDSSPYAPWPAERLAELGYPALHMPSSPALDGLHAGMELALRYPLPGLALPPAGSEPEALAAALKSQHPSAYFAGMLGGAWRRGEGAAVAPIADEARKPGVKLEPPHVNFSLDYPTVQRDGEGWSVVWGLGMLPGWSAASATRFVGARPDGGFTSLAGVVEAALSSGLGISQVRALVMAGGCDTLGDRPRDRHAMLLALPALFEWAEARAKQRGTASANQLDLFSAPDVPPPVEEDLRDDNAQTSFQVAHTAPSIYERYVRRQWEREHLGVTFTEANEMDALISALEASGGLRARLTSTGSVGHEQMGTSIHIVGLLCEIAFLRAEDGDTLAVGTLHDPQGTIEMVAFPPNYKRHAALWVENSVVAVTARVQAHQDGELYLLCEHIAQFSGGGTEESYSITIKTRAARGAATARETAQAAKPSQPARPDLRIVASQPSDTQRAPQPSAPAQPPAFTLIISIPDAEEDQTVIDSVIGLKRLLEEHPGADTVTIRVPYIRGRWTSASLSWGVRYSHQLEARIRRLLGDDAIAVIQLAS